MNKKILGVAILAMSLIGCSSAAVRGVKARAFIKEEKRVDQEFRGNAGYLMGESKPIDEESRKKTRKIYVLEFTKPLQNQHDVIEIEDNSDVSSEIDIPIRTESKKQTFPKSRKIDIPSFDEGDWSQDVSVDEPVNSVPTTYIEYEVEENDTLQKISKKFYDGYSQWTKIYEANKDLIPNPDRISPGITLRVPVE